MKYQTMKSRHDEEDGLLDESNTSIKNRWSIWSIVNVLLWTLTAGLLIYSLTNRIPPPQNISENINNIEQAVGSVDVSATVLKALKADEKNIKDKAVHIERKDKHIEMELIEDWNDYYFRDQYGLRVMYEDVLGKFHDSDLLSKELSIEIDGFVISDVHVEAINMNTEQAMIKTPLQNPSLFLLDCETCYKNLKNEESIENCECRVLTAKLRKVKELAVGTGVVDCSTDDSMSVNFEGDEVCILKLDKDTWNACITDDHCKKVLIAKRKEYIKSKAADAAKTAAKDAALTNTSEECLAGINVVDTPDGKKLMKDLKIDEYIKTGHRADGSAIYNRIVYLVAKGATRHIKLEVEDGSFVTLTSNHNVITENGEIESKQATLEDSLLHEDGTFKKIVSIENNVVDNTYIVRTTAFNGLIWTNGLYASENTVGDMTFFRKGYNLVVFKIVLRIPYFANFVYHHPSIGVYTDVIILIMVVSMISYGLRQKERSLKME